MKRSMIVIFTVSFFTFFVQLITMKPIHEYKELPTTHTSLYHLVFGVSITLFDYVVYGPPVNPPITTIVILCLMMIMRVL